MRIIAEFHDIKGESWTVGYDEAGRTCSVFRPDGTEAQIFSLEKDARDRCAELAGWTLDEKGVRTDPRPPFDPQNEKHQDMSAEDRNRLLSQRAVNVEP